MTHRERVDERHQALRTNVVRMGTLTNDMLRQSVNAVVTNDPGAINTIIESDNTIDALERETIALAMQCVAMEAPVASDLRFLMTTLGIVGEVEKAADHAVKLCRRIRKLSGMFPGELKLALTELGDQARRSLSSAIKLYMDYDKDLAAAIIEDDEAIDRQFSETRKRVLAMIPQQPEHTELLVRTINVFQAVEHVADHAVAIAKRLQLCYE